MQAFTDQRRPDTADELWMCEHEPVFTLGLAGQLSHVLDAQDTPVVHTNRGGQVTFHGPGQVLAYPLIDLRRTGYFVKEYVYRLEEAVIRTLMHFGVTGHRVRGAPGIFVNLSNPFGHGGIDISVKNSMIVSVNKDIDAIKTIASTSPDPTTIGFAGLGKIAALGVKVSQHCTYHGLALNVDMDLSAFDRINPCGYAGLTTVDLAQIGVKVSPPEVANQLARDLVARLAR